MTTPSTEPSQTSDSHSVRMPLESGALDKYIPAFTNVQEVFGRATDLAKVLFDVSQARVSLVEDVPDRFDTPSEAFTRDAASRSTAPGAPPAELRVLEDVRQHPSAADIIPDVIDGDVGFFASVPLLICDDLAVGALYLADAKPRPFDAGDRRILEHLAHLIVDSRLVDIASDVARTRAYALQIQSLTMALEQTREAILITKGQPVEPPGPSIVWINEALEALTGYCREDLLGEPPALLHAGDPENGLEAVGPALEDGRSVKTEGENVRKDGSTYRAQWNIAPVIDDDGALTHWVIVLKDVTEQRRREERLAYEATHDDLTGLLNRTALQDKIQECLQKESDDALHAAFYIDLDRFKMVNDSLGHAAGDQLLAEVGKVLEDEVGERGVTARLGGDEFAVCLRSARDRAEAEAFAARLCERLRSPVTLDGRRVYVSASVGIVLGFDDYTSAETLLADADIAMYAAKRSMENDWVVHEPSMRQRTEERFRLRSELPRAIEADEFVPYFQPIVNLDDGSLHGFEILARWQHPDLGIVSPGQFIDIAEQSGLIIPMGHQVIRKAIQTLGDLRQKNPSTFAIAISGNFSRREFFRPETRKLVREMIDEHDIPPADFMMEVTERTLVDLGEDEQREIDQLRGIGVTIVIDDFGTGFSSLRSLMQIPIDGLKLDRYLTAEVTESETGYELVRSVSSLCDRLDKTTTVEGIETEAQLDLVRDFPCTYGQGFLLARPVPAGDVEHLADDAPWKTFW